jgi:hypothetical protein
MNQLIVFNHHSLPYSSREEAELAVPQFLKICLKTNNLGLSTILIDEGIDQNWFRLQLANGYFWQDWYNKNNNNQHIDLIRAFRNIKTRQPFFSSEDIGDGLELFEVKLNGNSEYSAIKAAAWHETPLASFATKHPWNTSPIQIVVNEIDKDSRFISNLAEIENIYSIEIIERLAPFFLNERKKSIQSGTEIISNQNTCFPYVTFCALAIENLQNGSFSRTIFEQIKDSIASLNSFCEKWNDGIFETYSHENLRNAGLNHNVSGESQSVLQDQSLRNEREFWLPNGTKKLFENHIKISKGHRIYFYPDTSTKRVYVGYIGTHLRLR